MSHTESEVVNVKALMLLQSGKTEAVHTLRSMLIDAIINKFGSKRQMKPIPPIWQPASSDPTKRTEEAPSKKAEAKSSKSPNRSPENENNDSDSWNSVNLFEILEENRFTSCTVCRDLLHTSESLVECSECHSLYHKECHTPPITEDLSDPRVVWYCRDCIKPLCKPKTSDSSNSKPSKSNSTGLKSSSSSSGSKTFGGTRLGQSKSSSQSKSHLPSINIISADKRLQIMKKKAARKQDKRTVNK
ncbi:integrator complex subunit 12 isoform X2 [Cimex lectularius]|uniref:Integrator complex subunit 12 n=1 Tax=Cimex lectularius TaxID=79782 RepID=A0A8I6TN15_CIMLE|nr:integrator complex subunit 12 isoform X2 [Cimex lectularius]XP_024086200.1 integrator complex subunit 12 isoform X2 [Cimex lectularius]